jgi:hypothetical protein
MTTTDTTTTIPALDLFDCYRNVTTAIPEQPNLFDYYRDVTMTVGDKVYTIQELLAMTDDEFGTVYSLYQTNVANMLTNMEKNATNHLTIYTLIDGVERVRIERRVMNLEKLMGQNTVPA